MILCALLPASALAQPGQIPEQCQQPIAKWRAERDFGKKSIVFEALSDECKDVLYGSSSRASEPTVTTSTEASPAAHSHDPAHGLYVRADLGLNAPTGVISINGGKLFLGRNVIELGLGSGSASRFLSATYRRTTHDAGWTAAFGFGGSIGLPNNGGYDAEQHDEAPTTTTTWLHGEIAAQKLGQGFVAFAAFGLETLMSGTYHVDGGDINIIDREPYSAQPYIRFGFGGGF